MRDTGLSAADAWTVADGRRPVNMEGATTHSRLLAAVSEYACSGRSHALDPCVYKNGVFELH